jgi:hypothetical protein
MMRPTEWERRVHDCVSRSTISESPLSSGTAEYYATKTTFISRGSFISMLTFEGADDAEIIMRPSLDGKWQIEMPTAEGIRVTTVNDEQEALARASVLCPNAAIRILPAVESPATLRDGGKPSGD